MTHHDILAINGQLWICTVILNKVGKKGDTMCPARSRDAICTAPHGRHHSFLLQGGTAEGVKTYLEECGMYVARIEQGDLR